jgi:hypothetical protein
MVAGDRNDIFGTAVIDFLGRNVPVQGEPKHPAHSSQGVAPGEDINDVP